MKAIGFSRASDLADDGELVELSVDDPNPGPRDLLVEVKGVSVNPVDLKMCGRVAPGTPHVLGYDAAGVVKAIGAKVEHYRVGDEVFYAGDISRPGSNAELQVVDERIVGSKPASLDFTDAAGIPLTAITAWEILFDCFGLREGEGKGKALLVIGGAGGVGSILIQLARQLTDLEVIATASRPETREWVMRMGAHHVVDHRKPLDQEMAALNIAPCLVASLTGSDMHFPAIADLIDTRGHIALIDDPVALDILPFKRKAISISWEFMFARPLFDTDDMDVQRQLLDRVSYMLDSACLQSTVTHRAGSLTTENLMRAHALQGTGKAIGKTVLSGMGCSSTTT